MDAMEILRKGIMELVGTLILLTTIQVSVGTGASSPAVAIGLSLMVVIYAGAPISGAHYNPAVSLALALSGKQDFTEMLAYWAFQLVGGTLGALLGAYMAGTSIVGETKTGFTNGQAATVEIVYTFLLCFVVLSVATHSASAGNSFYGAAIGLTVTAGAISVGSISGGAFNPAVALGLCIAKAFLNIGYCSAIALCNLIGGLLAAIIYRLVAPDQFETAGKTAPEQENDGLVNGELPP